METINNKSSMQNTISSLKEVRPYLVDAANTVENVTTKRRIETQISVLDSCIKECENIEKSIQ
ncbi:MAG: hypothetical protein Q8936_09970 [Bacillota bacterium]|nr:hypothetical protein [Bacillota bacterium]